MSLQQRLKDPQAYSVPAVIIISTYALYLRLAKLANHKLWYDELYQLNLMKGSFLELLKALPRLEHDSYLSGDYYLIYPFFKIFGYNKWGLAIPHIIITILGFYLLYLICKRYFKTVWGYLISFGIVCFNATLIEHATEIRRYAVLPTLALICLYLSLKFVEQNVKMGINKKWAIGAFFILAIWFHVYGILTLLLTLIFSLLAKYKNPFFNTSLKETFKLLLVVLSLALPLWFVSVFGPHDPYTNLGIDTFKYIPNPAKDGIGFLKAIIGNLMGYKPLYFLLVGGIFPFIFPYQKRFLQILFLIIMVFVPLLAIFLADLRCSYWFLQRQFIWVMPFFAFFLGWSWDSTIAYFLNSGPNKWKSKL